jgi:hypothetical protein
MTADRFTHQRHGIALRRMERGAVATGWMSDQTAIDQPVDA